jgi:hypothetical protein
MHASDVESQTRPDDVSKKERQRTVRSLTFAFTYLPDE